MFHQACHVTSVHDSLAWWSKRWGRMGDTSCRSPCGTVKCPGDFPGDFLEAGTEWGVRMLVNACACVRTDAHTLPLAGTLRSRTGFRAGPGCAGCALGKNESPCCLGARRARGASPEAGRLDTVWKGKPRRVFASSFDRLASSIKHP